MLDVDEYTLHHLDTWLCAQVYDDTERAGIRERMLALVADDPDYWLSCGWWTVYDRVA